MTNEKWQDTVGKIKDSFKVLEEGSEVLPDYGNGTCVWIVFSAKGGSAPGGQGPLGKMKLERISHPRVIGKNVTHSKRIGSFATVEYTYDQSDIVSYVKAYKWDESRNDWEVFDNAGIV